MQGGTWFEIKNKEDIEHLMSEYGGFHDGCLKELRYISGEYVGKDLRMYPLNSLRNLYVIFQRQWENPSTIEMLFEELECLTLKPVGEDYTGDIFGAYMTIENNCLVWFDSDDFKDDYKELYEYSDVTWIKARRVKWRVAEECIGNAEIYHK